MSSSRITAILAVGFIVLAGVWIAMTLRWSGVEQQQQAEPRQREQLPPAEPPPADEPPSADATPPVDDEPSRPEAAATQPAEPAEPEGPWQPPRFAQMREERARMVEWQMAEASDGRSLITDQRVLEAMRQVPRHLFVPEHLAGGAHRDHPLPIGEGQTISQPYIVAKMTEALELQPDDRVLEIGTGSGYQAAVLTELTSHVFTLEIIETLSAQADERFTELGYDTIQRRATDGYGGWAEHAPFDAIIVTCAAGHLPPPLWEQLAPGGRIVIPLGGPLDVQRLTLVRKDEEGQRTSHVLTLCRFVPMTGRAERQ